jgi:hypothetical protein
VADVAFLGSADLWLTAEETRKVAAALAAVLEPYRGRALADRPDAARRVRVMNMVFPHQTADRPGHLHLPACGCAAGRFTVTRSPPALRGVRVRVPSCALVMLLTIARPSPTPAWSVRTRLMPR